MEDVYDIYRMENIEWLKQLEEPDNGPVVVVEPSGYYEFRDSILVESGKEIVKDAALQDAKCGGVVKENSKNASSSSKNIQLGQGRFKVEYRLSLKKYKDADDVLEKLRDRLKPYGRLPLNSAGEIVYRTEDIILVQ